MSPRPSALVLSASVLAVALALAGCTTPGSDPEPSGSGTPRPVPTDTAAPTPEPTASAGTSIPVSVACDSLISLQAMYDFNPNFSSMGAFSPAAGTAAADAASAQGTLCRWQNDTSGETIDVSVASFDAGTLERMANDTYDDSTMVPTYGGEGYFSIADGAGEAVVFDDGYWVVIRSAYFMEPGDAESLMSSVLSALP